MILLPLGSGAFSFLLLMGLRPCKGADPKLILSRHAPPPSLQMLDARYVSGVSHLLSAALLARNAWASGENVSRTPATEVLLFASGRRQINEAIALLGVHEGCGAWAIVAVCESEEQAKALASGLLAFGTEDDSILEMREEKFPYIMQMFGISDGEVSLASPLCASKEAAIASLVMERVSLSDLYR